jgi:cyclic-di-GMP-binding protein
VAQDCSFDIVSKVDLQEVDNAIHQTMKEIRTRYDLKDKKAEVARAEREVVIVAEDEFQVRAVREILGQKLARRSVPLKAISWSDPKPAAGSTMRQVASLQEGIPMEKAKEIVSIIKDLKMKVQPSIMGDQLRVRGRSRDELQQVMTHLKEKNLDFDIQFANYRS